MPLPEPKFDSRNYRQLLNEAIARIPTHNPEWTNFNDADPGITLLQLFAFLSEAIIYRANLIPKRNREKFLRLLGISMRAAEPARGLVEFKKLKGEIKTETLDENREVLAGNVPFRTENGLDVLPVEAKLYYKSPLPTTRKNEIKELYHNLYASYNKPERELEFYETKNWVFPDTGNVLPTLNLSKNTVDGALWIALLARPKEDPDKTREEIANKTLTLGIIPALDEKGLVLYPRGQSEAVDRPSLIFEVPNLEQEGGATYQQITPKTDIDPLTTPGIVHLKLPDKNQLGFWTELDPLEPGVGKYPPWIEDNNDMERLVCWIRLRSPEIDVQSEAGSRQHSVSLSWVGINAAKIVQRAEIRSEMLPKGTGKPDQTANFSNTPVILDSVKLTVNGEPWTRVDDLMTAAPEIDIHSPRFAADISASVKEKTIKDPCKAFTVDRESGEIRFGDGIHGKRPPEFAVIQVSYSYGGGREGSVGIGSINKVSNVSDGLKVSNPVPTWGGDERETVDEAEKRIPGFIRHGERLVSKDDYEKITKNTPGVDIERVEVLPLVHPEQEFQASEGVVTVMVIPKYDPQHPDAPVPDRLFLQTVCEYLAPRRILTTELHVRGPDYKDIWVSISIEVISGYDDGPVREKVRQAIVRFLSPLTGGFEGEGWPLGTAVDAAEISATATRVHGVAKVVDIHVQDSTKQETEPIAIEGLELPRLKAVVVVTGGLAPSIDEIKGNILPSGAGLEAGDRIGDTLPVPIVPDIC